MKLLNDYFNGDQMAMDSWRSKYQMKTPAGEPLETTPTEMHRRMAKEFARVEFDYQDKEITTQRNYEALSKFGKELVEKRASQSLQDIEDEFFSYFDHFSYIVPQGSIMSNLGNPYVFGSLSNCFGIAPPTDSYGGILKADEELVQLMKRRGGVGTHLNNVRPTGALVNNSSRTSVGIPLYAERYSNTTREVGQDGRRGALMLLLHVKHPDIFRFITMKSDRSKVTGANVSVMFTDEFMKAVEEEKDFLCNFPVNMQTNDFFQSQKAVTGETMTGKLNPTFDLQEYNKLYPFRSDTLGTTYVMKTKAKELFDLFVQMAWENGEPGAAFIDRITDYAPDGVYEEYKPEVANPCGEQWFHRNDTCRLIAINLFSIVKNPFSENPEIDLDKLYEISYMQQRLGDNLVDLEVEYIDKIMKKIEKDPEDEETKSRELKLWWNIRELALAGRRTGNGFTGLGDMLAAFGVKYAESEKEVELVMRTKMMAELDATIDMAILRGTFEGWDCGLEFQDYGNKRVEGTNSFYKMIRDEFPEQAKRMYLHGRRNVSWSTVAPTGTVSLMTQTTSGLEPLFKAYYIRRKKVNPSDKDVRVDFTDQNGDKWQEYSVLHPKFKDWIESRQLFDRLKNPDNWSDVLAYHGKEEYTELAKTGNKVLVAEDLPREMLEQFFRNSPWSESIAEDVNWQARLNINSVIQKYTSNALSCTINLPEDIDKETVNNLYFYGWKHGLKGITVYREGSRTGVLLSEKKLTNCDDFGYTDAIKRPKELEADYHFVNYRGENFAVIVGLLNGNPYEIFGYANPATTINMKGKITKVKSGEYRFESESRLTVIDNIQLSQHLDERLLTRMTSQLLRHGVSPKYIAQQVDKSEVQVVSFGKVIQRVLKTYIKDEVILSETCPNCEQQSLIYQEGCKRCTNCGHSKC